MQKKAKYKKANLSCVLFDSVKTVWSIFQNFSKMESQENDFSRKNIYPRFANISNRKLRLKTVKQKKNNIHNSVLYLFNIFMQIKNK